MADIEKPFAVFTLGGAANGKTAVIQAYFSTESFPNSELPVLESTRWCNPDFEKPRVATYTDAIGDEQAVEKFGSADLGGPSGPRNQAEFDQYPPDVRAKVATIVRDELGYNSIAQFVNEWLDEQNPQGEGTNFGKGLTHEISKALAQRRLLQCLSDEVPQKHFVWDAVGNADAYISCVAILRSHKSAQRSVHGGWPL